MDEDAAAKLDAMSPSPPTILRNTDANRDRRATDGRGTPSTHNKTTRV